MDEQPAAVAAPSKQVKTQVERPLHSVWSDSTQLDHVWFGYFASGGIQRSCFVAL